jgi:hypothetical protein
MAIARVFDGKGWTSDQFDSLNSKLIERLNLGPGQSAPGVLFHWSTNTADGMRVVDVYESREAADELAQQHIGPIASELGMSFPEITEYEVHAYLRQ